MISKYFWRTKFTKNIMFYNLDNLCYRSSNNHQFPTQTPNSIINFRLRILVFLFLILFCYLFILVLLFMFRSPKCPSAMFIRTLISCTVVHLVDIH